MKKRLTKRQLLSKRRRWEKKLAIAQAAQRAISEALLWTKWELGNGPSPHVKIGFNEK